MSQQQFLTREEIIEELKKIPAETIRVLNYKLTRGFNYIDLKESIIGATNYLPDNCKFTERLYQIIYNLTSRPLCPSCQKNQLQFRYFDKGYFECCSKKCSINYIRQKDETITNYLSREEILEQLGDFNSDEKEIKSLTSKLSQSKKYKLLKESIIETTNYLPNNCTISERLYHLKYNFESLQLCPICQKIPIKFLSFIKGYKTFCSDKCYHKFIKKQESPNNFKPQLTRDEVFQQLSQINLHTKTRELALKLLYNSELENLKWELYNVTNYLPQEASIAERLHHLKYNITSRPLCRNCKKNYTKFMDGGKGYLEYCSIKCQTSSPYKLEFVGEKVRQGRFQNSYFQMKSPERIGEDYELLTLFEEYEGVKQKYLKFKHEKCGHIFEYCIENGKKPRCPKCYAKLSRFEEEVRQFCEQYFDNLVYNSKQIIKPLEIDIHIPQLNIAIECNGIYWHREDQIGKNYHREKYLNCAKRNIQLIQIFEDEWKYKKELVKSQLLNIFDKSPNIIQASDCEIYTINQNLADRFLTHCHLEGSIIGTHYGLIYNDDLVSVISIAPLSNNSKYDLGIYRFCDMRNTKVEGGLESLINHIKRNHVNYKIAAYVDLRYSIGRELSNVGFKFVEVTEPTLSYLKADQRYPQPKTIEETKLLVESYDESKSIEENLIDNMFFRIFDCGYAIFESV